LAVGDADDITDLNSAHNVCANFCLIITSALDNFVQPRSINTLMYCIVLR